MLVQEIGELPTFHGGDVNWSEIDMGFRHNSNLEDSWKYDAYEDYITQAST